METPDDTSDLSAGSPNVLSAGVPIFTMPFPLAWSDGAVAPQLMQTSAPAQSPLSATMQTNAAAATMQVNAAAAAPMQVASKKGKGKANMKVKPMQKRIKWTNKMVGALLQLRFSDGDVKRRLETADTKTKKALAWQYFASVLSQSLGIVLTHDQISLKYRKLKCVYRKEKRELKKTGNDARRSEMDEGLWAILNDAFGGRVGISGEVLLDSAVDDDEEEEEEDVGGSKEESKQKPTPVAQLAIALQGGMEAIAASLGSRPSPDENLRALTISLQQQHEETRRFQELQLQLLCDILANRKD